MLSEGRQKGNRLEVTNISSKRPIYHKVFIVIKLFHTTQREMSWTNQPTSIQNLKVLKLSMLNVLNVPISSSCDVRKIVDKPVCSTYRAQNSKGAI